MLTVDENTSNSQQKKHCGLKARNYSWIEFFMTLNLTHWDSFFVIAHSNQPFSNEAFAVNGKCALYHREGTPGPRVALKVARPTLWQLFFRHE